MIVPCMEAWIEQWYLYVPALANVTVTVPPWEIAWSNAIGESASLVTVCEPLAPFQVTVVPAFTVSVAGENWKLETLTTLPLEPVGPVVSVGAAAAVSVGATVAVGAF